MTAKFIYFDLGNVLVHFDPDIACRQVAEVLQTDAATIHTAMYDSGIEVQLESGQIDETEFLDGLFGRVGKTADADETLTAMSSMFRVNVPMIPVVAKLVASGVPMGILSNTCRPHWNWISEQNYSLLRLIGPIAALSYEIGCMKPDPKIYATACDIAEVQADDILFIDDRLDNVQGAIDCGWNGIHYSTVSTLIRDLRRAGFHCFV